MNVIFLIVCLLFAAIFHQVLYILIPTLSVYYITSQKKPRLVFNPFLRLYLTTVVVIAAFILLQWLFNFEIQWFSIKGLARYITYFMFAVLLFMFDLEQLGKALRVLVLLMVAFLPLGVYQFIELGRYQGILQHANHLAYFLDICIYFVIIHRPFNNKVRTLLLIGLIVSLGLTKSSGGILVFLTLLAYNLFLSNAISFNRKAALLFYFVAGSFLVLNYSEKVAQQMESLNYLSFEFLEERTENFNGGGYGSVVWRIVYWTKILVTFFEEPLQRILFGIGVDHLTEGNMPYPFMKKDPHNDFVKVLVEFGVLGFLLFLKFFRSLYLAVFRNFNLIILIAIPMFFGNVIVNFPFNLSYILLVAYEGKKHTENPD